MPFTIEEFLNVFKQYNSGVWPAQIFLYIIALLALFFTTSGKRHSDTIITGALAFLWFWMGIVYHLIYFSSINKAAFLFGAVFIIEGMLFLYFGIFQPDTLRFSFQLNFRRVVGMALILYALLIYPILANRLGHIYPETPTFGLPCPTTIFTFGILLLANNRLPRAILIIPFLWSLIGFSAAINLGVKEDYGLVVAGLAGTVILYFLPTGHKKMTTFVR